MIPKVSVLIPVYKVSDYIEKCAYSLFDQTFQDDIEFIFVNDATPDDSIEKLETVIKMYPLRKSQITILHHDSNKGLATTRNTALNASSGDYIIVVDSDDYVEKDMVKLLYNEAIEKNADIVISDIFIETKNHQTLIKQNFDLINEDPFLGIIENKHISSYLCNKLVKSELYLHPECIVPDGLNLFEDRHVMTRLFYFANKIVKLNKAFYHYVQYNPNAITKNKSHMHFENVILFWQLLEEFLHQHALYDQYKNVVAFAKVSDKIELMLNVHTSTDLRKAYSTMFYEEETKYLKHFQRGQKLMLILVRYKLFGLVRLFNFYNNIKHKRQLR